MMKMEIQTERSRSLALHWRDSPSTKTLCCPILKDSTISDNKLRFVLQSYGVEQLEPNEGWIKEYGAIDSDSGK